MQSRKETPRPHKTFLATEQNSVLAVETSTIFLTVAKMHPTLWSGSSPLFDSSLVLLENSPVKLMDKDTSLESYKQEYWKEL